MGERLCSVPTIILDAILIAMSQKLGGRLCIQFCAAHLASRSDGHITLLDEHGDIVEGFRPRFNALNLDKVPQLHLVSDVPTFAPKGRIGVTGWLRSQ